MSVAVEQELKQGKPNLEVFSQTIQSLAENDTDIIVVTSDSRGSGKLVPFGQKFPDQIVEIGIAEQNLVGVSAGLASAGKRVFAVSPACFLTARGLEQIKNDVAYSDNAVKLIGISAGVSYGALGSTHHSLHDFAALRAINNISIVAPADNYEAQRAIELAVEADHPVYIRFGKKAMPYLDGENGGFEFGKGRLVRKGDDLTIIAAGEAVYPGLLAAQKLKKELGVEATVASMHTIKPLDYELIGELASNGKPVITVEEHSIYGGLGEACASYLMEKGFRNPFKIMGIPDEYTITGSQIDIFEHYDLSENGIAKAAANLLKLKGA